MYRIFYKEKNVFLKIVEKRIEEECIYDGVPHRR